MRNHLPGIIAAFFLASCIHVKMPFEPNSKAENLKFRSPKTPFEPLDTNLADAAWVSRKTGNTISFLSECRTQESKIEDVALDAVKAMDQVKVLNRSAVEVNRKKAYEVTATGRVDNSKVMTIVTTVQNGDCYVNLTYGGLEKFFPDELEIYDDFKKDFEIP